jgi:TRAP-type C4-dicarboxylate transport system permease small subunit
MVSPMKQMPRVIVAYVRFVDKVGQMVGVVAMILTFVLLGLLVESSVARLLFGVSHIWSVEMSMFTMTAYYLLGGALSEQDDYHVRMDLFYGRLSPRARSIMNCITGPALIFYLVFLFTGAVSNSHWAVVNKQVNYSPWAPPMAPVKIIMAIGIGLMLLQVVGTFFRDLAKALGRSIE